MACLNVLIFSQLNHQNPSYVNAMICEHYVKINNKGLHECSLWTCCC